MKLTIEPQPGPPVMPEHLVRIAVDSRVEELLVHHIIISKNLIQLYNLPGLGRQDAIKTDGRNLSPRQ